MSSRPRKLLEKRRAEANELVEWFLPILNGETQTIVRPRAGTRILKLLTGIQEIERIRNTLRNRPSQSDMRGRVSSYWPRVHFRDPKLEALNQGGCELVEELNSRLYRLRWFPQLIVGFDRPVTYTEMWPEPTCEANNENMAIWFLLREASAGRISRLRQCQECGRWFYAITDHQKYCQDACRQKHHSQSKEFKTKRALYMKETYRPGLKEREARAKQLAANRKDR